MFRRTILGLAVLTAMALTSASASTAEARRCGGYRGGSGGGYYSPSYSTSYYGGRHGGYYHRGPSVYRRSHYYGGGHPGYYGGRRSGVSLSFGF